MRMVVKTISTLLLLGIFLCTTYWKYSISNGESDSHRIRKRLVDEGGYLEEEEEELEHDPRIKQPAKEALYFKEHLPGYLVCQRKTKKQRLVKAEFEETLDELGERLRDETKKKGIRISSLNDPRRPIGCCPAGNENGQMYRVGFGCCIDKVYKEESHFCCLNKELVLKNGEDNREYCYPKDGIPYCRESDLHLEGKEPMVLKCKYDERNNPQFCSFVCPAGMVQTHGIQNTTCSDKGVWNNHPTCCEGCDSMLQLDLWFLIEVSQDYGFENFRYILKFLRNSLSYLPVSQDRVRVGVTLFNRVVFHDVGGWYMNEHNSHESISRAIDEIPIEGNGVNIGKALNWVATNAFTDETGDREEVDNFVVAILNGASEDQFLEPAALLKTVADVTTIGIGNNISDRDLKTLSSSARNVHRSKDFASLMELEKLLYKSICGETCQTE